MGASWSEILLAGKRADVFDRPGRPRCGVLFLHGVGLETLAQAPVFSRLLTDMNLACLCPHGQRSWWGDRVCAEFDPLVTPEKYLLTQALPYFRERWASSRAPSACSASAWADRARCGWPSSIRISSRSWRRSLPPSITT